MSYAYTGGMPTDRRRRRRAIRLGLLLLLVVLLIFAGLRLLDGIQSARTPPSAAPSPSSTCLEPPAGVTVDVLNATTRAGLAGVAADTLRAQRFEVGTVGNAPAGTKLTGPAEIRHGTKGKDGAAVLARHVRGAVMVQVDRADTRIDLVIGEGIDAVTPPADPPTC